MSMRKKKTASSAIGSMFADFQTNLTNSSGLELDHICAGEHCAKFSTDAVRVTVDSCYTVLSRATIAVPARVSGCGLGGLRSIRRLIATSRSARGFSFGISRNGIIAPVVSDNGLMPHGKPSGLSLPDRRSANPCGVSHLHGGWWGISYSRISGILAMMLTLTRSVSTAFIPTPEPVYKPVTSARESVSYGVSSDLAVVGHLLAKEHAFAIREPSALQRSTRLNALRSVAVDVLRFCDETLGRAYTPVQVEEV